VEVAADLGRNQRLHHQSLHGLVVEYDAIAQQAVMAVAGVGIESDVAEYPDLRHSLLDGPDGSTHQIVRIERLASVVVPALRVGVGKERETGNGKLGGALGLSHGLVDPETLDARHRAD